MNKNIGIAMHHKIMKVLFQFELLLFYGTLKLQLEQSQLSR